jgi:hypothetical protein
MPRGRMASHREPGRRSSGLSLAIFSGVCARTAARSDVASSRIAGSASNPRLLRSPRQRRLQGNGCGTRRSWSGGNCGDRPCDQDAVRSRRGERQGGRRQSPQRRPTKFTEESGGLMSTTRWSLLALADTQGLQLSRRPALQSRAPGGRSAAGQHAQISLDQKSNSDILFIRN